MTEAEPVEVVAVAAPVEKEGVIDEEVARPAAEKDDAMTEAEPVEVVAVVAPAEEDGDAMAETEPVEVVAVVAPAPVGILVPQASEKAPTPAVVTEPAAVVMSAKAVEDDAAAAQNEMEDGSAGAVGWSQKVKVTSSTSSFCTVIVSNSSKGPYDISPANNEMCMKLWAECDNDKKELDQAKANVLALKTGPLAGLVPQMESEIERKEVLLADRCSKLDEFHGALVEQLDVAMEEDSAFNMAAVEDGNLAGLLDSAAREQTEISHFLAQCPQRKIIPTQEWISSTKSQVKICIELMQKSLDQGSQELQKARSDVSSFEEGLLKGFVPTMKEQIARHQADLEKRLSKKRSVEEAFVERDGRFAYVKFARAKLLKADEAVEAAKKKTVA